jgi:hypothetical protein
MISACSTEDRTRPSLRLSTRCTEHIKFTLYSALPRFIHPSLPISLTHSSHPPLSLSPFLQHTGRSEQLAYQMTPLPGLFSRTKLIKVMPHFIILNVRDFDQFVYSLIYGTHITCRLSIHQPLISHLSFTLVHFDLISHIILF